MSCRARLSRWISDDVLQRQGDTRSQGQGPDATGPAIQVDRALQPLGVTAQQGVTDEPFKLQAASVGDQCSLRQDRPKEGFGCRIDESNAQVLAHRQQRIRGCTGNGCKPLHSGIRLCLPLRGCLTHLSHLTRPS